MSKTKWTPGPWRVVRPNEDPRRVYVRDQGGLSAERPFPTRYDGQDERFALEVGQYEADAHLIAAAPDLAEAVSEMLEHEPSREDFRSGQRGDLQFKIATQVWARARAALAKARGEER